MNKETVKKLIENGVFQKWLDGEKLQILSGQWVDVDHPAFRADFFCYRIKPSPKYRAFKPEEFKLIIDKTIVSKETNVKHKISDVSINYNNLFINVSYNKIDSGTLLKEFKFEDGSPCGVLTE